MITPRVWAPHARSVALVAAGAERPLRDAGGGWWEHAAGLAHGDRYAFRVDGGPPLPDPRAVRLPEGVHGPAEAYDHGRFAWTDDGWTGRPLAGGVIHEVHVGTFTPAGTLDAAAERLAYLAELGITHVELMPLASFDGPRGWGYDGAGIWAVHEPYGGLDRAHAAGLAVVLDVVHNHLGPSGNHLGAFGPYFTGRHHTPWGLALNLDDRGSDEVRAWMIGNAVSWLRDFHLDGLRLDAVQTLVDDRAVHVLEELSAEVDALAASLGRPLTLIAETDRNDPRTVTPRGAGGLGIHAQWDDDLHHALHALLTGERQAYYVDFGTLDVLAHVLGHAFLHDGRWSGFRGRSHGRPVDRERTEGWRFVVSLQTHDQVGNRATGDRLTALAEPALLRIGAALLLTSPFTPMLFMGEEWGASTPWCYFTSFPDRELGAAVTEGRRREFAEHGWPLDLRGLAPGLGRAGADAARRDPRLVPASDRAAPGRTGPAGPAPGPRAQRVGRGCPLDRRAPRPVPRGREPGRGRGEPAAGGDGNRDPAGHPRRRRAGRRPCQGPGAGLRDRGDLTRVATRRCMRAPASRANRSCSPRPNMRKPHRTTGFATRAGLETAWMRNHTSPVPVSLTAQKSIWPISRCPSRVR